VVSPRLDNNPTMISESRLESTEHGLVRNGLRARTCSTTTVNCWFPRAGRSAIAICEVPYEGEPDFLQFGIPSGSRSLPGRSRWRCTHWEARPGILPVLSGERCSLSRRRTPSCGSGTSVHCPLHKHVIVARATRSCVVLAVGAR